MKEERKKSGFVGHKPAVGAIFGPGCIKNLSL